MRVKNFGVKFRRQHGIGRYVVDFFAPAVKLVIEVDGDSHGTEVAQKYDDERQKEIERLGLKVIRFTNEDVLQNMDGVLESIHRELQRQSLPL